MITNLTVYLNNKQKQKLGILAQKNRKTYFEYDKEFLKRGIEISPYKLPLKAGVQLCRDDTFEGIWGLFADSLPDGWGRLLMDRHFRKLGINPASLTPLDRLAFIGSLTMGALSYEPSSESKEPILQEIGAIEYAYSLMARDAGLDMPRTALLIGKKGRYFACERFDRAGDKKVHMHSAAGLVHSDFRYPILDYDDLLFGFASYQKCTRARESF